MVNTSSGNNSTFPMPYYANGTSIFVNNNNVFVETTSDLSSYNGLITIDYY